MNNVSCGRDMTEILLTAAKDTMHSFNKIISFVGYIGVIVWVHPFFCQSKKQLNLC